MYDSILFASIKSNILFSERMMSKQLRAACLGDGEIMRIESSNSFQCRINIKTEEGNHAGCPLLLTYSYLI